MSENAIQPKVSRVKTTDGAGDPYDHAISLIDATEARENPQDGPKTPGWRDLARKPTQESVRQQLARRKYAKWRQDTSALDEEPITPRPTISRNNSSELLQAATQEQADTTDFADRNETVNAVQSRGHDKSRRKTRRRKQEDYEIDILYENQRGMFFFGIPLYSHSSLLNFDPGPWVTKELKDSAVNITNAQVPDPSWVWTWKAWYVDMSYDVDEEGWQYSFSFSKQFVWHGTHPWFHSFVRRRRWLRKRVKRQLPGQEKPGSMQAAHKLNTDYFTIHSKRERSPGSVIDDPTKTARPDNYISMDGQKSEEEAPEDIRNIPSVLQALKLAAIDRTKIDIVKKFVEQGGEELVYLKDRIPEIMSFMVFQNSRQQVLAYLKDTAEDAQKHREEHDAEDKPEGEAETRRINNLLAAVEACDGEVLGLEYWSDRKNVLKTIEDEASESDVADDIKSPVADIKGISEKAEIERPEDSKLPAVLEEEPREEAQNKGKDKEEFVSMSEEPEGGPRLGNDAVFIPDEDGLD